MNLTRHAKSIFRNKRGWSGDVLTMMDEVSDEDTEEHCNTVIA